jgi:hypothetical protein
VDLAQFIALMAMVIGGFALIVVLFIRLEGRVDRLADRVDRIGERVEHFELRLPAEFQQLRRDLAEDLAAQRAEATRQLTAITNAILAARGER